MSHSIKVSDDVYKRLQRLQGPRETYNEVVDRCLSVVETVKGISDQLGPSHYLQERPVVQADAVRRDVEARTIRR